METQSMDSSRQGKSFSHPHLIRFVFSCNSFNLIPPWLIWSLCSPPIPVALWCHLHRISSAAFVITPDFGFTCLCSHVFSCVLITIHIIFINIPQFSRTSSGPIWLCLVSSLNLRVVSPRWSHRLISILPALSVICSYFYYWYYWSRFSTVIAVVVLILLSANTVQHCHSSTKLWSTPGVPQNFHNSNHACLKHLFKRIYEGTGTRQNAT